MSHFAGTCESLCFHQCCHASVQDLFRPPQLLSDQQCLFSSPLTSLISVELCFQLVSLFGCSIPKFSTTSDNHIMRVLRALGINSGCRGSGSSSSSSSSSLLSSSSLSSSSSSSCAWTKNQVNGARLMSSHHKVPGKIRCVLMRQSVAIL